MIKEGVMRIFLFSWKGFSFFYFQKKISDVPDKETREEITKKVDDLEEKFLKELDKVPPQPNLTKDEQEKFAMDLAEKLGNFIESFNNIMEKQEMFEEMIKVP